MNEWINSEFATLDLNDERLNKRACDIISKLYLAPGRTIPQAFQVSKDVKACYRFFKNERTSLKKVLAPHAEQTINRIKEFPTVLLINDTSDLDYSNKISMQGKGKLSNSLEGIFIHPLIAVTPERLNLGSVDVKVWQRGPGNEIHRDLLPIEEKESFRWLEGYRKAKEVTKECPGTQIIYLADREADIIELIEEANESPETHIIIRAQHDRQLDEKDPEGTINKPYKKLIKSLIESPSIGEVKFNIPTGRGARPVTQKLKAGTFRCRMKKKNQTVRIVSINVVMAIEEGVPDGLCWTLITTLPISSEKEIKQVLNYYLCRWEIELFFKILKSGCKIEERYLKTVEKMEVLISIFCVVSWRIMYCMMLGRLCPDMCCENLFSESEWKSVYKISKGKLPDKPPSLNEFIIMVANLGGYIKGKYPPGIKVMWTGMARMLDFSIAWEAFGK